MHKDRLFNLLFGSESFKENTLSLYNAINGTDYSDPDLITFNTIQNFLYMGVNNDVSFIIADTLNIYEHQSTLSSNMPVRMLNYLTRLFETFISENELSVFRENPIKLPAPKFIVFYNGEKDIEDEMIFSLSQHFDTDADIELNVRFLNINYGHNKKLMEKCEALNDYSKLIYDIRQNKKKGMDDIQAIDNAIMELNNDSVIKPIILKNKSEVRDMMYDEEFDRIHTERLYKEMKEDSWNAGKIEGKAEGIIEGTELTLEKVRTSMRDSGISDDQINIILSRVN